jgi:hypothetical protein
MRVHALLVSAFHQLFTETFQRFTGVSASRGNGNQESLDSFLAA